MSVVEDRLRVSMSAYAAAVPVGEVDLAAAERTLRRRTRVRAGLAAGVAVVLSATGVGLVATAGHGGGTATQTAADPDQGGGPLPGFHRAASVRVPDNLVVYGQSESGGQVWAVGSDPSNNEPLLMHARDGGVLVPVRAFPYGDVSDIRVVVRGGLALTVSTRNDLTGSPPDHAYLRVYDAATTVQLREVDLTRTYGADGATLLTTAPDGRLAVLIARAAGSTGENVADRAGGRETLATAVLGVDGVLARPTPFVPLPPYLLEVQGTPDFDELSTVVSVDGAVRYAYLDAGIGTVARLDLLTGRTAVVVVAPGVDEAAGGEGARAVGLVAGRMLYETEVGLAVGPVATLRPTVVRDVSATLPGTDSLVLVAGRLFRYRNGATSTTVQQLDPATLRPTGPVLVQDATSGAMPYDDATAAVQRPLDPRRGVGGTLTVYTPE